MAAENGTVTTRPAVTPNLEAASLDNAGAFLRAATHRPPHGPGSALRRRSRRMS